MWWTLTLWFLVIIKLKAVHELVADVDEEEEND